jgi:hypothetical protein
VPGVAREREKPIKVDTDEKKPSGNMDAVLGVVMRRKRAIQQRHRGLGLEVEVAVSTLQAVQYLITVGDPERIRAFLAKHSRGEQLAIKHIMSRESK